MSFKLNEIVIGERVLSIFNVVIFNFNICCNVFHFFFFFIYFSLSWRLGSWRIILQRILVNLVVMGLLAASAYTVVELVNQ